MPDLYVAVSELEGALHAFEWNEAEHPRGKTTERSTPGSFAPKGVASTDPEERRRAREEVTGTLMRTMWDQLHNGESIGFSYQPVHEESPTDGFMVAKYPERALQVPDNADEGVTEDDIAYFIEQNADLFRGDPDAHVGGWLDTETGTFWLDVSTRRDSLDEALTDAVDLGELAVWDIANKRGINVKDEIDKWAKRTGAERERVEQWRKRHNLAARRALRLPAQCDASGDCGGHQETAREIQLRQAGAAEFRRAEARVAFAVIEQRTNSEERIAQQRVSKLLANGIMDSLGGQFLTQWYLDHPQEITAVDVPPDVKGRIKRAFEDSLARAWYMGREFAVTEVDRAKATAIKAFREWREEDHPRGKTTDPSTGGSFKPKGAASREVTEQKTIEGVKVEDIKDPTATAIGEEFNPDEWRKKGMRQAREEWQKLSVQARDRMAAPDRQIEDRATEIVGEAVFPDTGNAEGDIDAYVEQFAEILPRQDRELVKDYARVLLEDMQAAGVDEANARDYALKLTRLIIAQDFEAAGRTLGDHGIHHILGDWKLATEVLKADPDYAGDPAKLAGLSIAIALHDSGYMTYPARLFLDDLHGHWSAAYYNAAHFERVTEMLGEEVATAVGQWIEYHDTTHVDFEEFPELSALGIADNFALFHAEKMPPMLRHVPENVKVLTSLGAGKISVEEARDAMRFNIAQASLSPRLKEQLTFAVEEVSGVLPKYTLGMVGAKVAGVEWKEDHPLINIERYRANEALGKVVHFNGQQFDKLCSTYKTSVDDFAKTGRLLARDLKGRVRLEVLMRTKMTQQERVVTFRADLADRALEWLEANGFRMAGNLTDGAKAIIQDELLNAVRMGLRAEDVSVRIWERLIKRGFLFVEDVFDVERNPNVLRRLEYLLASTAEGETVRIFPWYIETLARTNIYEAFNEARLAEYTDPALGDFVVALEYSAILDHRTTVLCQSLHGFTRAATDPVWEIYNPPNHYNCRSVLIPITAIDGWDGEESPYPKYEPQVGFFTDAMRNVVRLFHYPGGQDHDQQNHGNRDGRAPAGGIFGLNGEWYKGGQFLPGSERTVKGAYRVPKSQGKGKKAEIEPGVWKPRPFDGASPLKPALADFMDWREWRESGSGVLHETAQTHADYLARQFNTTADEVLRQAQDAIDAWAAGVRWTDPEGFGYDAEGNPVRRQFSRADFHYPGNPPQDHDQSKHGRKGLAPVARARDETPRRGKAEKVSKADQIISELEKAYEGYNPSAARFKEIGIENSPYGTRIRFNEDGQRFEPDDEAKRTLRNMVAEAVALTGIDPERIIIDESENRPTFTLNGEEHQYSGYYMPQDDEIVMYARAYVMPQTVVDEATGDVVERWNDVVFGDDFKDGLLHEIGHWQFDKARHIKPEFPDAISDGIKAITGFGFSVGMTDYARKWVNAARNELSWAAERDINPMRLESISSALNESWAEVVAGRVKLTKEGSVAVSHFADRMGMRREEARKASKLWTEYIRSMDKAVKVGVKTPRKKKARITT